MENDTQHKTPKNLTNNKQGEALKESPDQIVDETVYIENFYDQQNIEEQKKSMAKLPQPPQLDGNEDLDMDFWTTVRLILRSFFVQMEQETTEPADSSFCSRL